MTAKEVVFSGVQPSGKLHVGNYAGALSVWADKQSLFENIFCVVDMHALTIPEAVNPHLLRQKSREVAALYIACGIDPKLSTIFIQSDVREHAELQWILGCVTPLGWVERMTQFKAKSERRKTVGTGLLTYPILQAADIMLYDADKVPVGEDQKQHIELTREIGQRFNHLFGETLVLPEPLIRTTGARIMGLDDPSVKMSKSIGEEKPGHSIGLLDSPREIQKAIARATTDSAPAIDFAHLSAGTENLLSLYHAFSGQSMSELRELFEGKQYGALKKSLTELMVERLEPIQTRYAEIMMDSDYLDEVLKSGASKARSIARRTMRRVRRAVGTSGS